MQGYGYPQQGMPQAQMAQQQSYAQPLLPPTYTSAAPQPTIVPNSSQPQVTAAPDPAILQLASNDDLDVATLARQANRHKEELQDEVVISLH